MVKRNVWILNHYAVTPDMPGGTRHYDLGKELLKRGYTVTIFASGFDHSTKRYTKLKPPESVRIEDYQGVRFVWLKTLPYYANDWRRILNMISYATTVLKAGERLEKPDVVIGSSMHPFAALAGWWLARKYKVKFIFEVRDIWPQTAVDMGAMKATSIPARLLYIWEKLMYQKAEKIIVLLPNAAQYIEGRGIDPRKIVWIPNGVDLERFDDPEPLDPSSGAAQALAEKRNKFKVIYSGAHGPANGLDVVIDAAAILSAKCPSVQFFLLGDGSEKAKLVDMAKQYGISNVTFLDPIPKFQIPAFLKEADVLLHCLRPLNVFRHGISPNKIYDYLASGKPIIMSVKAANNIVQEACAGVTVEPGNPKALAEGILELYQMNKEDRERLGANGRAYVEEHHDIKKLAEKLANVINSVVTP